MRQAPWRHRAHRRCGGLTLLEVLVALAILGVLASLAMPAIARVVDRWKLQAVAERLVHDLAAARFDAARLGQAQQVVIQDGPAWCWSVSALESCGCGEPQPCQRQRVAAPRHSTIRLAGAPVIRFESNAAAQPGSPSVEAVTPHGDRLRVVLTPMGRARICSPEGPRMGYAAC